MNLPLIIFTCLALCGLCADALCQINARSEILIPGIPGYETVFCDFHLHTVFSDGNVWPTIRLKEAWQQGLDAISITDHIEYQPYKKDVATDHNRPYEIALPEAEKYGIILIRGAEITRNMPPGHINAIFLQDANPLKTEKWEDAVAAAHDQGAFIFWNHPGWRGQQPDGIARWYDEHTELVSKGIVRGIEVVNDGEYYPEAHQWCLDKNVTMLGNSDVHDPIYMAFDSTLGKHRPLTLVFAKEKTPESIKEALEKGRTVVYHDHSLIGRQEYLQAIFTGSIQIRNQNVTLKGKNRVYIQLHNSSQLDYMLSLVKAPDEISVPETLTLYGGKGMIFWIRAKDDTLTGIKTISIPYSVANLKPATDQGLQVTLDITIDFQP